MRKCRPSWLAGVVGCAAMVWASNPSADVSPRQADVQSLGRDWPAAITLPAELDRVLRDYEAAWRDGDGGRLASLFTDDGFAIQSGRPIARGRDAIRHSVRGPGGALRLSAYAIAVDGTLAHIVGGYAYDTDTAVSGRFVLALRRAPGGRWLIAADIDNAGPSR